MSSPVEQQDGEVRLTVLESFLAGTVPTTASIAHSLGISPDAAGASFERLAGGRAFVLVPETHELLMAAPFAARPSGFAVHLQGNAAVIQANCVWDALGIASMTHRDADIDTECPCCRESLRLEVRGDQVTGEGIVHFAVPAARWWDDIGYT